MKLLIESAMIFFGTLMAAAVVALGEPARAEMATANDVAQRVSEPVRHDVHRDPTWVDVASRKPGFGVR